MAGESTGGRPPTLDGQLVGYWEREAARFDDLARRAMFGWIARGYGRKAARARAQAERSRAREAARAHHRDGDAEGGRDRGAGEPAEEAATPDRARSGIGRRARNDPSGSRLLGAWRIFESDLWDADFLDLVDPAAMTIPAGGQGEFAFGAVTASMDIGFAGPDDISFTFEGSDEGTPVSGSGFAELLEDGTLEIDLSFHLGDDAVLKARRP